MNKRILDDVKLPVHSWLLDQEYRGLTRTAEAYDAFIKLNNACKAVGSAFVLLWHNTQFTMDQVRDLYEAVLKA